MACAGAVEGPSELVGGDDLHRTPPLRSVGGLDIGAQEHAVAAVLLIEPPLVFEVRLTVSCFALFRPSTLNP